jgi:hypothetical protein
MTQISGRVQNMTVKWFHKNPVHSNQHCLYCGVLVGEGATVLSDKEHLIARKFVPTGSLGNDSFNFIFRACCECNGKKADFERHVSSVTLVNSPARATDVRADESARRKAIKDFHPDKKGVPVGQAIDNHSIEFNHRGLSMKFDLQSPPKVNPYYVEQLASYHIQALFSLVTTEDYLVPEKMQLLPTSQFRYFSHFTCHDWGNPHLLEIAKRVDDWPCFVNVATAGGYFKVVLKIHEGVAFWALEWNHHLRVVGAIARESESLELFEGLPGLGWELLPDGSGRRRRQTPLLAETEDRLFSGDVVAHDINNKVLT